MAVTIRVGADTTIRIPAIVDAAGTLINPAGCSIRSQVRARSDLAPILYEWGTAIPGTVVFTTGQVDLIIPNGVSAGWTWSSGEWDVELTDGAGKKAWIAHDTITVEPRTTH